MYSITCSISARIWHTIAVSKSAATKDPNKEQETVTGSGETYDYLFVVHSAITF